MSTVIKNKKFSSEFLKQYEIFAKLSSKQIDLFTQSIKQIQYNTQEVIIREGEVGNSILILLDGEVEISVALTLKSDTSDLDTREKSLIKLSSDFHPFFGEMCLFNKEDKRTATVTANSVCVLGRITKGDFFKICNSHPEIGNQVMQNIAGVICGRLVQANNNVLKLTTAFSLMVES